MSDNKNKKDNLQIMRYGKAQDSAEHYNILIHSVLGAGIALSLFILYNGVIYNNNINYKLTFLFFGYLILLASALIIEAFSQLRLYFLHLQNKIIEEKIKELPYFKLTWLIESIILILLIFYIYIFYKNNSLLFVISLFLFLIVVINWILRPKGNGGNCIEKFRQCLMGTKLKDYNEIIKKN